MAKALGYKFLNAEGNELKEGGGNLNQLAFIDDSSVTPSLNGVEIIVACDVSNPLIGANGASVIYGPQKGASPEMVKNLDDNLKHLGKILEDKFKIAIIDVPGAGAAGGLGAGLLAFTNAKLQAGFEIVKTETNLENAIINSDLIITGEGKIDAQTINGKTPYGVAQIAFKYNKPLIGVAGYLGNGYTELYQHGFTAIFPLANGPISLAESIDNTPQLLIELGEKLGRLLNIR